MASRHLPFLLCSFARSSQNLKSIQPGRATCTLWDSSFGLSKHADFIKTVQLLSQRDLKTCWATIVSSLTATCPMHLLTVLALFAYTSGRWLHLDKLQRDARYLKFDFSRLCQKVLSVCPSATSIKSCEKLEGGFSKAFIMKTDCRRRVVAKFRMSVVGPASYVTNSEVAAITYSEEKVSGCW